MALTGPQHAKEAEAILWKAEHEKNPADKALQLAEGNLHATLALLAAVVHGGGMDNDQINWWEKHGVRK
jgi:hypothetical protein